MRLLKSGIGCACPPADQAQRCFPGRRPRVPCDRSWTGGGAGHPPHDGAEPPRRTAGATRCPSPLPLPSSCRSAARRSRRRRSRRGVRCTGFVLQHRPASKK